MPKVITNLRETILKKAKDELLLNGYDSLAIRRIAASCGIAVGTIYNYFPSKEVLCAAVMLDDWLQALKSMRVNAGRAASVNEGLTVLYDGVVAYSAIYQSVWSGYTFSAGARSAFGKRHNLLVRQLADIVAPLLRRFRMDAGGSADVLLAENILLCAGESELTFASFLPLAARMLVPEREIHIENDNG